MKILYSIFLSLSVFILSIVLVVKQNTKIILGDSDQYYTLSVTVAKDKSADDVKSILQKIKSINKDKIYSVSLFSTADQIEDVRTSFPGYNSGLIDSGEVEQILQPIIEIKIFKEPNDTEISNKIIDEIIKISGLSDAVSNTEWTQQFKNLFLVLNAALYSIFILFFIMLSFLISILIRNYLIESKNKIEIYALSGATPHQAFFQHYVKIISGTVMAYLVGIILNLMLIFFIKNRIAVDIQFTFISDRISYLNLESIFIIFIGLVFNLFLSYILSYRYIISEYYKND